MNDAASLFITGATGFIGRRLLRAVDPTKYATIYCLSRTVAGNSNRGTPSNLHWIRGCVEEPESYRDFLASSDIVVHMAAKTGKARPEDYFRVNFHGTRLLTEECRRLGVTKFLFVSSIAAKFSNISRYYYAQSKQKAEEVVGDSLLNYAIVRPTIVLGKESPAWARLSQLAKGPFIVLLGKGSTQLQPVYVDDMVNVILELIRRGNLSQQRLDVGGPEVISLEDFLQKIHFHYHKKNGPVIRVPFQQLSRTVAFVESYAPRFLPFNSGQLAVFANDSTAEPNEWVQHARPRMKNVDTILSILTADS
jgi:nucleoside-diphosphate-sugar epimerase